MKTDFPEIPELKIEKHDDLLIVSGNVFGLYLEVEYSYIEMEHDFFASLLRENIHTEFDGYSKEKKLSMFNRHIEVDAIRKILDEFLHEMKIK